MTHHAIEGAGESPYTPYLKTAPGLANMRVQVGNLLGGIAAVHGHNFLPHRAFQMEADPGFGLALPRPCLAQHNLARDLCRVEAILNHA